MPEGSNSSKTEMHGTCSHGQRGHRPSILFKLPMRMNDPDNYIKARWSAVMVCNEACFHVVSIIFSVPADISSVVPNTRQKIPGWPFSVAHSLELNSTVVGHIFLSTYMKRT